MGHNIVMLSEAKHLSAQRDRPFASLRVANCRKERTIMTQVAPYGSWKSPITSDLIVSETIKFEQVVLDGSDIYWIERRPTESGRCVIVRRTSDGNITDMLPPPYNARTSVHEYGGGSFPSLGCPILFSNFP